MVAHGLAVKTVVVLPARILQVPRGGEARGSGGTDLQGHRAHVLLEDRRGHEVRHEERAHGRGSLHAGKEFHVVWTAVALGCSAGPRKTPVEWGPVAPVKVLYSE